MADLGSEEEGQDHCFRESGRVENAHCNWAALRAHPGRTSGLN